MTSTSHSPGRPAVRPTVRVVTGLYVFAAAVGLLLGGPVEQWCAAALIAVVGLRLLPSLRRTPSGRGDDGEEDRGV
ncbi:hypothetical protein [Streptomyces sp. AM 2-1-1]|uniref:hypothetical protein n=1 Tax=Streptomyces sp. AM 2-1-1 TaxID=3028709 RepID=UPI0023B9CFE3|nr:hypothetical protein [Streptomyces sp. AM 2-1-1]WEH41197.1 hypothetical protein PZB77_17780 [Streptomyces sp. AM 2-1-1]